MAQFNKVYLLGHIGQAPDTRFTTSGNPVVTFSMATDEGYYDKDNEKWVERAEWHRIVMFGKRAENVGEKAYKGALVLVEGKLQTRSWDDKDGIKRYTTEIVAQRIQIIKTKSSDDEPKPSKSKESKVDPPDDDDLPF